MNINNIFWQANKYFSFVFKYSKKNLFPVIVECTPMTFYYTGGMS